MREKPKQPKAAIIIVSVITGILVLVGLGLVYMITRQKSLDTTPSGSSKCCICTWSSGESEVAKSLGYISNGACSFSNSFTLGDETVSGCSDITLQDGTELIANSSDSPCDIDSAGYSSSPIIPPTTITDDNQEVELYAYFKLYKINDTDRYSVAQIEFEYPNEDQSPPPLQIDIDEDSENVDIQETKENQITVETYRIKFLTSWNTILDPETPGFYKISFTAKNQDNEWTQSTRNTRIFEVKDALNTGYFCSSLDIAQPGNTGSQNVTIETIKSNDLADDQIGKYKWSLDLNCDGNINSSSEVFETDDKTITKEFEYPENETSDVTCSVNVEIYLTDGTLIPNQTASSCSDQVTLSASTITAVCGNGVCDSGETCESDGNLTCPEGTDLPTGKTCRIDCTYCGDGILNSNEECDPAIQSGTLGYQENCLDNCTIPDTQTNIDDVDERDNVTDTDETDQTEDDSNQPDDVTDPGKDQVVEPTAETLSITYTTPSCLETTAPNNTGTFTINVDNPSNTAQVINGVSDTLPAGYNYNTGSSIINGIANTNDTGVLIETSGNTQLISFNNSDNGWTLQPQESLIISLNATAGTYATTGIQTSTVIVAPLNTNPITKTSDSTLAETCQQPDTGLFDSNTIVILSGSVLLILATAVYSTGLGSKEINIQNHKAESNSKNVISQRSKSELRNQRKIEEKARKILEQHARKRNTGK